MILFYHFIVKSVCAKICIMNSGVIIIKQAQTQKRVNFLASLPRLPFKIINDKKNDKKLPELHVKEGDLFYCLEGQTDFVCGGLLLNQTNRINTNGTLNISELSGSKIKNGVSYKLKQGDWLWIPPNTPHQHNSNSMALLIIVKIPYYL